MKDKETMQENKAVKIMLKNIISQTNSDRKSFNRYSCNEN